MGDVQPEEPLGDVTVDQAPSAMYAAVLKHAEKESCQVDVPAGHEPADASSGAKRRRVEDAGQEPIAEAGGADGAEKEDDGEWTYDELWKPQQVSQGWHRRNVRFWQRQPANIRGATGGGISKRDLEFTTNLVRGIVLKERGDGGRFACGLDLGAGVGRVTHAVLQHHCLHVDLVEFAQKHLAKAEEKLTAEGAVEGASDGSLRAEGHPKCTFAFHAVSAQEFKVEPGRYDFVWCQWLLMYLTDADVISVLTRVREGLQKGGLILVKENVSTVDKATYFDRANGDLWEEGDRGPGPVSVVRTAPHYFDLFDRAGLLMVKEVMQKDPTGKTMDMTAWTLCPTPARKLAKA